MYRFFEVDCVSAEKEVTMKMEDVASKPENIRRDGRAPNHVASKLKVGIIAGTRAWYLLQILSELENDTRARRPQISALTCFVPETFKRFLLRTARQ